jgi:hypothetical protein
LIAKVDRLVLKTMAGESPKEQILGWRRIVTRLRIMLASIAKKGGFNRCHQMSKITLDKIAVID